jgi:hypothetical protein
VNPEASIGFPRASSTGEGRRAAFKREHAEDALAARWIRGVGAAWHYHGLVGRFWSRAELQAQPSPERLRRIALLYWLAHGIGILFGLQLAFVEGHRVVGLAIAGIGVVSLPCPLVLTVRARRLARDR